MAGEGVGGPDRLPASCRRRVQADKSYGIQVARLAGLPGRASWSGRATLLDNLESQEYDLTGKPRIARGPGKPEAVGSPSIELNLFTPPDEIVVAILREVDLEQLSPACCAESAGVSLRARLGGREHSAD